MHCLRIQSLDGNRLGEKFLKQGNVQLLILPIGKKVRDLHSVKRGDSPILLEDSLEQIVGDSHVLG